MAKIMVFRKETEAPVKYSSRVATSTVEEIKGSLRVATRVSRPGLTDHFLPTNVGKSNFAKSDTVTRAELHHLQACKRAKHMDAAAKATEAKGYVLTKKDLGRAPKNGGERDWNSTGQSILLYCKDRIATAAAEHGVTVASTDGADSDVSVIVIK